MNYLHELFTAAVARSAGHPALDGPGGSVGYDQLAADVDAVHGVLLDRGVRDGMRVGVQTLRTDRLYSIVLALARIDCTLVPLPPGPTPSENARLQRIGTAFVVGATGPDEALEVVRTGDGTPGRPAAGGYLLSTSGSTGRPKDVLISDARLRAYGEFLAGTDRVSARDRLVQNFVPYFDAFFEVLMMSLQAGATIVTPRLRENLLAARFCADWGITVWNSVPSQLRIADRLRSLAPGSIPGVRLAVFGGEALTPAVLAAWRRAAPRSTVVNSYGPTETTIAVAEHVITPETDLAAYRGRVPIGTVIDGVEHRLVPPTPDHGAAELCLRGRQRFDGYEDPADNRGRFYRETAGGMVPVAGAPGPEDWYRTGDLVTDGPSGLVLLGRINREVKVLGKRIDLTEVEACLEADGGVAAATVVVVGDEIHAVAEPAGQLDPNRSVDTSGLRPYARPQAIHWVTELPRLPSGKTDLGAVAEMVRSAARRIPLGGP